MEDHRQVFVDRRLDSIASRLHPVPPTSAASPVSPVSPASPARPPPRSPLPPIAEDRRLSQFVEHQKCPLPEIVIDPAESAPEPLSNLDRNDDSEGPVVEPDIGDQRSPAVVYTGPKHWWSWRSRRWPWQWSWSWMWTWTSTCSWTRMCMWMSLHKSYTASGFIVAGIIVVIAITLGVMTLLHHKYHPDGGDVRSPSTTSVSSPSASSSSTPTATSSGHSSTSTPSACASPGSFMSRVSWMGVENATGGWKTAYSAASDAATCCSICYKSQPSGCDGWAWMPVASSPGTACNMIVGYTGEGNDTACPSGHTGITLSTDSSNASHVGGAGPCATVA